MTFVRVDRADGVAVLTVDNPPVNALGNAVLDELRAAGVSEDQIQQMTRDNPRRLFGQQTPY